MKSIIKSLYEYFNSNSDNFSFLLISTSIILLGFAVTLITHQVTQKSEGWFSTKVITTNPYDEEGGCLFFIALVILFLGIGTYFFVDNKSPQITTINSTNELISNSNISVKENKKPLNLTVDNSYDNSNNTDTYIQTKNKILKAPTHWYSSLFNGFIVGIFPPIEIYYSYYYSNKIIYEQGWFYYNIKAILASIFGLFVGGILLGGILSLILGEDDGFSLSLTLYGFSFVCILIYKVFSLGLDYKPIFITWTF